MNNSTQLTFNSITTSDESNPIISPAQLDDIKHRFTASECSLVLATDLDGTFLHGSNTSRLALKDLIEENRSSVLLVFVTGRGVESVKDTFSDPLVPKPDIIISDVGATVVDGANLQPINEIQNIVAAQWPGTDIVRAALSVFPYLTEQIVPQSNRLSYFVAENKVTKELYEMVESLGCTTLFSAGMYFDVLPKNASKGAALNLLVEHFDLDSNRVLTAGDTLNDYSMLSEKYKSVIVSNAEQGLLDMIPADFNVFHASAPGAEGILQAIEHYNLLASS